MHRARDAGGGTGGPRCAGEDVRGPLRSRFPMVLPGFLVAGGVMLSLLPCIWRRGHPPPPLF